MNAPAPAQLVELLTERLGDGVEDLEPLEGGAWSRAFGFRHRDRGLVVRFSATGDDFRNDERAGRYRSHALPIPVVVEIGQALGGYYAISERHAGTFLDEADSDTMRTLLPALFDTLDALRTADVSSTTGFGAWDADGNGAHATWRAALLAVANDRPESRIHGWRLHLAASPDVERVFADAYAELERLAPDLPDARHLVHSDLLNRNVLVAGTRITAVLDWGSALYGDFLFDLGWLTFWQPWYESWAAVGIRAAAARHYETIGLDVPDRDRRLRACELSIALGGMAYQAWAGHEALTWTAKRTLELLAPARRLR